MSETLVQRPTPIPQPPAAEVINVDDFIPNGDDDVQFISHIPVRRFHEPIVIDDSDDDVEIVAGPAHRPPANINRRVERPIHMRRRILFSPSPPPPDNHIPPVPPLPPQARNTPPLRWRGPPDFSHVVRPLDRPLPFEEGVRAQPPMPAIRNAQREAQSAAAEHQAARRPNMGLGGALFAFNPRNVFEPAYPQLPPERPEHAGGWRNLFNNLGLGAYRMLFHGPDGSVEPAMYDGVDDADLLAALAFDADERRREFRTRAYPRPNLHRHESPNNRKAEPDYVSTFTHPAKPEAGFTNDFAPHEAITITDAPGPSVGHAGEGGSLLVCALCLDPLIMNVVASDEEVRKRKLFALRCGHMLDGKCTDSLMRPAPTPPLESESNDDDNVPSSRKGKGKADNSSFAGFNMGDEETVLPQTEAASSYWPAKSNKEKQIAVDPDGETQYETRRIYKRKSSAYVGPSTSTLYTRSRLRPRNGETESPTPIDAVPSSSQLVSPANDSMSSAVPTLASPDSSPTRHAGGRRGRGRGRGRGGASRRGRGKGKGKAKAPDFVIEAEYEWSCPVLNCGHKHKSVRIGGVWRMDGTRGAIPMYV